MIRLTIRLLVYALVLAITISFSPGVTIQPLIPGVIDISSTYLFFGILFGLINAFIRPLVWLLTARQVVRTMGLFAFVINIFLFWLMTIIVPGVFIIASPKLLWISIGGVILTLVALVLEALLGLDMPAYRSQIETQVYWRWVRFLSTGRRNTIAENLRAAQIMDIISRYTQDIAVERTPLARLRYTVQELLFQDVDQMRKLSLPEKVRYMIQEMGPTFVKFGQIISSRTMDLPPEWREQLEKLQSNVPPFSFEKARQIIIDELHDTPENLFASFDESLLQPLRSRKHTGPHCMMARKWLLRCNVPILRLPSKQTSILSMIWRSKFRRSKIGPNPWICMGW